MKNKALLFSFVLITIIAISFSGYILYSNKNYVLKNLYSGNSKNITLVIITNGSDGRKTDITDKEDINNLISELQKYKFEKLDKNIDRVGFSNAYTSFEGNKQTLDIIFFGDKLCTINGASYKVKN